MSLATVRRVLGRALAGHAPDEAALREALAALDSHESAIHGAAVDVRESPIHEAPGAVSANEAIYALASIFVVMENLLVDVRNKAGARLVISNDAADAFIKARDVLKRSGFEPIARRKAEPLHFTPILGKVR